MLETKGAAGCAVLVLCMSCAGARSSSSSDTTAASKHEAEPYTGVTAEQATRKARSDGNTEPADVALGHHSDGNASGGVVTGSPQADPTSPPSPDGRL